MAAVRSPRGGTPAPFPHRGAHASGHLPPAVSPAPPGSRCLAAAIDATMFMITLRSSSARAFRCTVSPAPEPGPSPLPASPAGCGRTAAQRVRSRSRAPFRPPRLGRGHGPARTAPETLAVILHKTHPHIYGATLGGASRCRSCCGGRPHPAVGNVYVFQWVHRGVEGFRVLARMCAARWADIAGLGCYRCGPREYARRAARCRGGGEMKVGRTGVRACAGRGRGRSAGGAASVGVRGGGVGAVSAGGACGRARRRRSRTTCTGRACGGARTRRRWRCTRHSFRRAGMWRRRASVWSGCGGRTLRRRRRSWGSVARRRRAVQRGLESLGYGAGTGGRDVRSEDAGGDTRVAVGEGSGGDGVSDGGAGRDVAGGGEGGGGGETGRGGAPRKEEAEAQLRRQAAAEAAAGPRPPDGPRRSAREAEAAERERSESSHVAGADAALDRGECETAKGHVSALAGLNPGHPRLDGLGGEVERCEAAAEIAPEMVRIKGGCFLMGSPESESGRWVDDERQHRVCVKDFSTGKHEVTFAQWDACVSGGGCGGIARMTRVGVVGTIRSST